VSPLVYEHARCSKTKFGNHHISIYRSVFNGEDPNRVSKSDII
jgi:hypothetical protein